MATAFAPLTDDKPSTVSAYDVPASQLSPLIDTGREAQQQRSVAERSDPATAPGIALERRLAAEGSSTSTLSHILAWVAAAKGDFRGLTAIEDAKRRTALGKAIVPEIRQYNKLVTAGKLTEADEYLNTISNSFGTRAPELVPYLTQMSQQLDTRRKQVESNITRAEMLDEQVPKDHPYRSVVDSFVKMARSGKYIHAEDMRQALQQAEPHVQVLNNQVVTSIPTTGATSTQALPQVVPASATDDFIGNTLAPKYNITTQELAGVLNNAPQVLNVLAARGITPQVAERIRSDYIKLLPIKAQLEGLVKNLPMDPTKTLQAIRTSGVFKAAMRDFSPDDVADIETGVMDWLTKQKAAEIRATTEYNPLAPKGAGYVTIGLDPASSHYLREVSPAALADVQRSGGRLGSVRQEVLDKELKPAQYGLESLDLMPALLAGNTPETRGDRLAAGINRLVSARIGYPLTEEVEVRQAAKSILNTAIEQVENAQVAHLQGRDRADIADLKRFASGDFKTNDELLQAADYVRDRLQQIIDRAIGGLLQETQRPARSTQRSGAAQQPTTSDLEGNMPKGRQPVVDTKMQVPPALKNTVREYERKQGLPPGSTEDYTAPTPAAPAQAAPQSGEAAKPTALDRVKRAIELQKQQRGK